MSFKALSKPIPISLGDNSKIFMTGKGTIHLLFNVLYMPDATVTVQKVAAMLMSSPSQLIDITTLRRYLGYLGVDDCHVMVNHHLVDGIDRIIVREGFCKGCAYGHSK